jgi:hypothetical protein
MAGQDVRIPVAGTAQDEREFDRRVIEKAKVLGWASRRGP